MTGAAREKQVIGRLVEKELSGGVRHRGRLRDITFEWLRPDGSSRKFIRVFSGGEPVCIAVLPASREDRAMAEFRAAVDIGNHLHNAGAAVPRVLASDAAAGLILFEDFGDTRLHDICAGNRRQAIDRYPEVIKELVRLQVKGSRNFDRSWCYDTAVYDTGVMLTRESGYFLEAFWHDTLHGKTVEGLVEEFEDIAARVMSSSDPLFLHRDFQSRNVMISGERIGIIDFQAGRLGPPGYDLASLLIDPYAALSDAEQQSLFSQYINEMKAYPEVDIDRIRRSFPFLALQRNLQIIGAFSYLSGKMQKPFFRPYILPSLLSLNTRLAESVFQQYAVLRKTVEEALRRYTTAVG